MGDGGKPNPNRRGVQMPAVTSLDHPVLTVADTDITIVFRRDVLGMQAALFHPADGSTRWALCFGQQKVNLRPTDEGFAPHAKRPTPVTAELFF